ncbi:hypothetical protein PR048_027427 [Dryococelus australis]|uniref:HTH CENPB-type domain-containing protein n=1 Tax=Dryococelus australis TaxID=614101 RepID=A0ABQ9GGI1_9NEOP|nr:hypothetical protein PR048_027427 [Dryococelus australis]
MIGASDLKDRQRLCCPKYDAMEDKLLKWYHEMHAANLQVSGHLVQLKDDYIALRLGISDLKFSSGWLQRFKDNNNVVFKHVCGESAAVKKQAVAHSAEGLKLECVTLVFLPRNTSFLQPVDQGIIQSLNKKYTIRLVSYLIRQLEIQRTSNLKWNVLDAIRSEGEDEVIVERWVRHQEQLQFQEKFDDFLQVDNSVATSAAPLNEDLMCAGPSHTATEIDEGKEEEKKSGKLDFSSLLQSGDRTELSSLGIHEVYAPDGSRVL